MITEEEIKKGSVNAFEHLMPEVRKVDLISIIRLLDIVPIMEQILVDDYIESLTDKHIFKQSIKQKLNDVSSRLERVNGEVFRVMDRSGNNTNESRLDWYEGYQGLARKFVSAMKYYITSLETMTNISEAVSVKEREEFILNKAEFLFNLNPGDIFMYLDTTSGFEYTYVGLFNKDDGSKYCKFKRINGDYSTVEIEEDKLLRPVIKMNLVNDEELKELAKINKDLTKE